MLISIGAHPFLLPAPVLLIGVYDEFDRPNLMTAAWGGICASQPPCVAVSLRRATWTHHAILERKAFTINLPSESQVAKADLAGTITGAPSSHREEGEMEDKLNKFERLQWTPLTADHVDAPYAAECPVVLEMALRHTLEIGSHTQFVGEVMDIKVEKSMLSTAGLPIPESIKPILFSPLTREYFGLGAFLGRAFSIGKTVK